MKSLLGALAVASFCNTAYAETWVCSVNEDKAPVITRWIVDGDTLHDELVLNDDHGLTPPTVSTLAINKQNGAYAIGILPSGRSNDGRCAKA